jgi:hypothetical protein
MYLPGIPRQDAGRSKFSIPSKTLCVVTHEGGGPKSDQSSSIALNTMCVEDWAILGLEASVAGVLNGHPAVS